MSTVNKFEDLKVWQVARELVNSIYIVTNNANFTKDFSLINQMRSASVSVMANISEGFARRSSKEFAQFLNIAHASAAEVQSHLYIALDLTYINNQDFDKLYVKCTEISKMLYSLQNYLIKNSQLKTIKMKLKTTYMSGAGNTFTVVDNSKYGYSSDFYGLIASYLCGINRDDAFKTEGLLILNESKEGHSFDVDFFNPDGSFSMMCGNGGRCALMFAIHEKIIPVPNIEQQISFRMAGGIYKSQLLGDIVRLFLPAPVEIRKDVEVKIYGKTLIGTYVNVNSDHFVINYDETEKIKDKTFDDFCIDTFASPIRFHKDFKPNGVNVNIYTIRSRKEIWLRTYERGVEAETGACGTGALSTMLTALVKDEIDLPVTIIPPSKSPLIANIDGKFPNKINSLILEGNAEIKKQMEIEIPENLYNFKK